MEAIQILVYIIKVIAIQGLFFGFYWLALRNNASHALNRVYLLSTLCLSLSIPFIQLPFSMETQPVVESTMIEWIAVPIQDDETSTLASSSAIFPMCSVLLWAYLLLLGLLLLRSVLHLYCFKKIKNESELVSSKWYSLFKTSHIQPFSFLSNVFIPKTIFGTEAYDQILVHECEHVRQWHSVDRILVDFLVSLFWFNPFIYLYRNALIEVHEFQADASVIRQFQDPIGYQEMLFAQLQPVRYSGLVSHFNFSTIKKRIVMMNKSKTVGNSRLIYVLTLPLVALVLFAFTSRETERSVERLTVSIEMSDSKPQQDVVLQEDRFKPSILPLKTDRKFIVSSTYGMRNDPISGSAKFHKGMDLATEIGAEVVSTADGEVVEVVSSPDGYGNHIVIKHGDVYLTKYGQLSEFKVKGGDQVKKGQVIALSGSSGQSTGPHLHYEVYKNGEDVNPMDYIKNYKFSISKTKLESDNEVLAEKEKVIAEHQLVLAEVSKVKAQEAKEVAEISELAASEVKKVEAEMEVVKKVEAVLAVKEVKMAEMQKELSAMKVELARSKELIRVQEIAIAKEKEAKEK